MTLRPLRPADLGAAHALWQRSAALDPIPPAVLAEKLWGDPAGPALAAEIGGDLAGVGSGAIWYVPGEPTGRRSQRRGSVRLLAVAPERRRRGVGSALLRALAEALRQRGATSLRIGEAAPNYLTPGVDVRYDAAPAFFAAHGLRETGEAVNLGVDLMEEDWATTGDEARLDAAGVSVRRATEADRAALAALLDAHWPAWQPEADGALARRPPAVHLALRDGGALGFAAHSATNAPLGWFGPMGTAPEARGLGVGAVLLRRCLADLKAEGHERATIAWAAALPFYERACGATVERRFRRFERAL
ncbi:GNAT family N-acetyltransferase [Rubrivirga marina]|uniref:N-acetyltransferase domain-containing protein n=1 Tax=Rubrivirga marina TaxID=1196024 RepID=A0A271J5T2_9BACT|nr:GNAT family N-acetyltransferase [Rubrivirga marina]PAP78315.1 hypothetical protein BSZ37_18755 [Rubrivirga marina]